jgi:hypothetical protein
MKRLAYLLSLLVASVCLANVIRVPEDYSSVQMAVSSSTPQDTVLVDSGIYLVTSPIIIEHSLRIIGSQNTILVVTGSINGYFLSSSNTATIKDIYISQIEFSASQTAQVWGFFNLQDNIVFSNCIADGLRGADYLSFGGIGGQFSIIENSTFSHFANVSFGGNNTIVDHCLFSTISGFGISNNGNLTINNSTFEYIYNHFSASANNENPGNIFNCTFNSINSGYASYSFQFGGGWNIANCIIWNCSFDHQYGCLIRTNPSSSGQVYLSYTVIEGGSLYLCDDGPGDIAYGEGNILNNPLWEPNYELQPNSPCIDAGDPSSPLDPDGTRADIGAYYYCQGEGINLPDIVRTSTEPGYPEPIMATLQSTCDLVVIDSARTETGLFTLDDYPSQVAGEFKSGDFQLTFHPSVQGVFTDTLHIWANTDPPHHKIPLVGESGPIPAPVTDLSISILPDLSALLTWSPVTQTIYGNPVTPDYYLIFYNEDNPLNDADWYYLYPVTNTTFTHPMVARFADLMNYRVVAWKGIDPSLIGISPGMGWIESKQRTSNAASR